MLAEIIKIIMQNTPFSVDILGSVPLTFEDMVRLKLTCRELNESINQYWVFNITRSDYRVYQDVVRNGLQYLCLVHEVDCVERFIQLFGYVYRGSYPLHAARLNNDIIKLHMKYGADPYFCGDTLSLFDMLVYEYHNESFEIIDYILTCKPLDINAYTFRYSTVFNTKNIPYYLVDRPILVPIFLKHGLNCNSLIDEVGLAARFRAYPHIVAEILKYSIRLDILERDLEYVTTRANFIGLSTLYETRDMISKEIQRRTKN